MQASGRTDREAIATSQSKRLADLLQQIYGRNPFYTRKLDAFGLRGRLLEKTDLKAAARSFELGLASDPLAEEVACRGRFSIGQDLDDPTFLAPSAGPAAGANGAKAAGADQADAAAWLALCEAARRLPRD